MSEHEERDFESMLVYLQRSRGFDFTGYKRPSLMRRVSKRMEMVGIESFSDYTDYLEVHPEEFALLFNTILINVTSFFRDPHAWDYLRREVVPAILRQKQAPEHIRVWSAGCASGEEAYSLAIVLAEAMGADDFRERVKIYATDVDEEALNQARTASYGVKELQALEPALRDRYFEPVNARYVFRSDLRRAVISDATISSRMRPSRASICWCAATRSCISMPRRRRASSRASTSRSRTPPATCSWGGRSCC